MKVRPAPRSGVYEKEFWRHVEERRLHLQYCSDCRHSWYPPGPACPRCLSRAWSWEAVSGRGRLLSQATFHRQYFDTLPAPYTVVAGALDEGPILITDVDARPEDLEIGMPLELTYRRAQSPEGEAFTLYHWRFQ